MVTGALAAVHKHGECWWEAALYRSKGKLPRTISGQWSQGGSLFSAGPRHHPPSGSEVAGAASRLWRCQSQRTEARQLLAEIYSWFIAGLETADLKQAQGVARRPL